MTDKDGNLTRVEQERLAEHIELMKSGDIPIPGANVIPFNGKVEELERSGPPRKLPESRPGVPFYESMTAMRSEEVGINVRVWRKIPEIPTGPDKAVLAAFKSITTDDDMVTMAYKFAGIPDVTAFEITDSRGFGVVVYTEW